MTDETNLQAETPAEGANPLPQETEAASAPPTETVPETDSPTDDAGKPEPKGVGKRIDELTRNWREEQRRNEQLMAMLVQMQQRPEPPKVEEPPPPSAPPTLEQFGYDEAKYQAALVDFAKAEARREVQQVLARERAEAEAKAKAETFSKRQSEFIAKQPDYEAKVLRDPTLPISDVMAEVIRESEDGPALAYYLAENRELAANIARLSERAAARELGRIEAKLQAQREANTRPAAPPKPAVSQAPPPVAKIEASEPDAPKSVYDEGISIQDFFKLREKQEARARRR